MNNDDNDEFLFDSENYLFSKFLENYTPSLSSTPPPPHHQQQQQQQSCLTVSEQFLLNKGGVEQLFLDGTSEGVTTECIPSSLEFNNNLSLEISLKSTTAVVVVGRRENSGQRQELIVESKSKNSQKHRRVEDDINKLRNFGEKYNLSNSKLYGNDNDALKYFEDSYQIYNNNNNNKQ